MLATLLDVRFKAIPFLSETASLDAFHYMTIRAEMIFAEMAPVVKGDPIDPDSKYPASPSLADVDSHSGEECESSQEAKKIKVDGAEQPEPGEQTGTALLTLFEEAHIIKVSAGPQLTPLQLAEQEVQLFTQTKPVAMGEDPLKWWKCNAPAYPILARVARHYLCIPVCLYPLKEYFPQQETSSLLKEHP